MDEDDYQSIIMSGNRARGFQCTSDAVNTVLNEALGKYVNDNNFLHLMLDRFCYWSPLINIVLFIILLCLLLVRFYK